MGLELEGNILIFDEAHHVPEKLEQANSESISISDILEIYHNDSGLCNLKEAR